MKLFKLLIIFFLLLPGIVSSWDNRRLAAPVVVDGRIIHYPEFAVYFMPKQKFTVNFLDSQKGGQVTFADKTSTVGSKPLQAPENPGLYRLEITNNDGPETALINVFVMVPANTVSSSGYLNGYRIGSYPRTPLKGNKIYLPPKGFVEVTPDNINTRVSPNFTLGQFVSKQAQGFPKYLVLRASLLLKLENILASLNRSGRKTDSFVIMSGYRTPWYNRSIGNVPYSRHVWGGASDFYIDENPRDGLMDDLNGDGKINRDDAHWLAKFIDQMSRRGEFGERIGGIGVYGSNSAHGPFVHIDVRGVRARW